MGTITRSLFLIALIVGMAGQLFAQEEATTTAAAETTATAETATTTTGTTTSAEGARSSYQVRDQFSVLLRQRPTEVATILQLDPSLLADDAFLAKYPELRDFVQKHPEVRHNSQFYLEPFEFHTRRPESLAEEVLEGLTIFSVFGLIAFALAWLVRTIIEQKRWSRLSKTQTEVHNKILDRFGTSAELMEYIRTPAGTKFLESAPIPLHTESRVAKNTPLARVMWSIQLGIIVAAGAFGLLLVSFRFDRDTAADLFAMGTIGFCVGGGFIASALISLFMSRKLGALAGDDPETVK